MFLVFSSFLCFTHWKGYKHFCFVLCVSVCVCVFFCFNCCLFKFYMAVNHCYISSIHSSTVINTPIMILLFLSKFRPSYASLVFIFALLFFSNLIVTTTTDYCVVCCFAVFASHQFHSFAPMQCYLFCFFLRRSFLFRSSPFLLVDDVLTLLFFCVCVCI